MQKVVVCCDFCANVVVATSWLLILYARLPRSTNPRLSSLVYFFGIRGWHILPETTLIQLYLIQLIFRIGLFNFIFNKK